MKTATLLAPLALVALTAAPAAAQAPGSAPAPAAPYYAPADAAPPAQGWEATRQTWGIGLRTSSQNLAAKSDEERENAVDLAGAGLQLRYRINRRWEVELSAEHTMGELAGGAATRHSGAVTLAGIFHMRPHANWDWYLLAGFGGSGQVIERDGKDGETIEESFAQAHGHLGIGLERRFRRFGIGAELRFVGAALDPEEGDAPSYMEGAAPIPEEENGGQLNLTATYYF